MKDRISYSESGLIKSPEVKVVSKNDANYLLDKYHYLGGIRTCSECLGHEEGCTVWGVLRSRAWDKRLKEKGFNPIELIRMVGVEGKHWATSSLLAKSVKLLKEKYDIFVTYADPMQQHTGNTYLAANWERLPQDAQPDGYLWRLDGAICSRKRFFAELGTSAISVVKQHYGDRITIEKDVPKRRFFFIKEKRKIPIFLEASQKVKTWGKTRTDNHILRS